MSETPRTKASQAFNPTINASSLEGMRAALFDITIPEVNEAITRLERELAAERERADRAKAEGIKEGMRRAAEIAGAKEDQFIALAGEAADNTMRKHYSALASGAGTAAAAILKEIGE